MREFLNAKTVVVAESPAVIVPTPLEKSPDTAAPELTLEPSSEPIPDTAPDNLADKPSEFQHIADQLRKFDPSKPTPPSAESADPAPLEPEFIPEDPSKDADAPQPPDGSMLHLR
jgi:hypothetical protein